jgi:hypothetical protein
MGNAPLRIEYPYNSIQMTLLKAKEVQWKKECLFGINRFISSPITSDFVGNTGKISVECGIVTGVV